MYIYESNAYIIYPMLGHLAPPLSFVHALMSHKNISSPLEIEMTRYNCCRIKKRQQKEYQMMVWQQFKSVNRVYSLWIYDLNGF